MRFRLFSFVGLIGVLLGQTLLGAAPTTIAGKIFRTTYVTSTRAAISCTLVLGIDQRSSYLLYQRGNVLDTPVGPVYQLGSRQPGDGTYTYSQTGSETAVLVQTNGDGSTDTFSLHFDSDNSGTLSLRSDTSGTSASISTFTVVDPAQFQTQPLLNVSLRGRTASGQALIAGFVIPGTTARTVLIRAVGPGLAALGVGNVWSDPDFQLYRGNTALNLQTVGYNYPHYADWTVDPSGAVTSGVLTSAFQKIFTFLGAFPLTAGSKDAADIVQLTPGAYTIVASPSGNDTGGETLIEIYLLP